MDKLLIIVIIILLGLRVSLAKESAPNQLMHAQTITIEELPEPLIDFIISEKLDGVRAVWTGTELITRQGNKINAPEWFTDALPAIKIEGELWLGRKQFEQTVSIVNKQQPIDAEWQQIKFYLFDLPDSKEIFSKRVYALKSLVKKTELPWLKVVKHQQFSDFYSLKKYFHHTIENGGEGMMLNLANAHYTQGRTNLIYKLKPYYDDEAIVLKHVKGKGKFSNMLGALVVKNEKGKIFRIGTGFSDEQRLNPPAIGSEITYQYQGLTNSGKPRFASFMRQKSQ